MLICNWLLPGISEATTVPATTPQQAAHMAKFRARIDGLEGGSHEELKTPPAARQAAPKDVASVPKLKKEVQSRRILDEGNGVKDASASTSARANHLAKARPMMLSQKRWPSLQSRQKWQSKKT